MSNNPQNFLEKKVNPIFEPLLASIIQEKPKDPVIPS